MTSRPFLLLTNDDGISAPGIYHLWQAVAPYADIAIVAPQREKSGCGLSITWAKPLLIQEVSWDSSTPAWSLNGTPSDCVKMGTNVLLKRTPDMILSGINRGSNAGRTVLYSGTVGGVIEGALKGIPGIAFSFSDSTIPPLEITQSYIFPIVEHFLRHPLPQGTFLNVNFPLNCQERLKGFRLAKQGKGYWIESPEQRLHPEGIPYYWLGGKWHECEEDPESDVTLLSQGFAAGVPIHISELTDQDAYEKHRHLLEELFPEHPSVDCPSTENAP